MHGCLRATVGRQGLVTCLLLSHVYPAAGFVERLSSEHLGQEHWEPSSSIFYDPPHLYEEYMNASRVGLSSPSPAIDSIHARRDRVRELLRVASSSSLPDVLVHLCGLGWRAMEFSTLACASPAQYIQVRGRGRPGGQTTCLGIFLFMLTPCRVVCLCQTVGVRGFSLLVAVQHFSVEREFVVQPEDAPLASLLLQCRALDMELHWCHRVVRHLTLERLCALEQLGHAHSNASRALQDACRIHKAPLDYGVEILAPADRARYYGTKLPVLVQASARAAEQPGCRVCVEVEGRPGGGCLDAQDIREAPE